MLDILARLHRAILDLGDVDTMSRKRLKVVREDCDPHTTALLLQLVTAHGLGAAVHREDRKPNRRHHRYYTEPQPSGMPMHESNFIPS